MQIDERIVDDVTVLDLKGKMTLGEGDELLKDKINSLVSQGHKKILLNLEAVPYIDSAGPGRDRADLHEHQPPGRQAEALERLEAHPGSPRHHEADHDLRQLRQRDRSGPELRRLACAGGRAAALRRTHVRPPHRAARARPSVSASMSDFVEPGARPFPCSSTLASTRAVDQEPHPLRRAAFRSAPHRSRRGRARRGGIRHLLRPVGCRLHRQRRRGPRGGSTASAEARRPIASGALPPGRALAIAAALGSIALAAAWLLGRDFGATAAAYVALQTAYSLALKQIVILDVLTIAIGFVLRAAAGAVVIDVRSASGCCCARCCWRCSWRSASAATS